jgi:hypothetical protein
VTAQPAFAGTSTDGGHAGESQPGTGELARAAEALAGLAPAALSSIGGTAALASLGAVRRLAAELERGELALIEAARDDGATWSQISAALGTRNRQTAQKRHADLARRCPRPPSVDIPPAHPAPGLPDPTAGSRRPKAEPPEAEDAPASDGQLPGQLQLPLAPASGTRPAPAAPSPPPGKPATPRRRTAVPQITDEVIAGSLYELVKAPDYAETRSWLVLAGGRAAGRVRPTWHRERSRPAWEPVDLSGLPLPVKGTGRVTPAGNARTRDAAAVSLLRALQHQQQEEDKQRKPATATRRAARPPRAETA